MSAKNASGNGSLMNSFLCCFLSSGQVISQSFSCSYTKKRQQDRYFQFDPRPEGAAAASTSTENSDKFLRNLQTLPKTSMWERLLFFSYDDYELESNKRIILEIQVQSLVSHMEVSRSLN
jgi:hypothetical protein